MSALDDLFDGHYFTDDPHVYIPIDEAQQELAELRADNARLQKAVDEAEGLMRFSGAPVFVKWLKEYGKEAP